MKELDEDQRLKRSRRRAQLMQGMQQGDPDACRALLDDIGSSLTYFLRRRVADPHELEDVYQEVFMAIFEARHTYEPGRPFEPWLFAIARNIAVDYTRRRWSALAGKSLSRNCLSNRWTHRTPRLPNLEPFSPNFRLISLKPSRC
jgi:DNA-directed RNA polymerase specialized sigma24 family protein